MLWTLSFFLALPCFLPKYLSLRSVGRGSCSSDERPSKSSDNLAPKTPAIIFVQSHQPFDSNFTALQVALVPSPLDVPPFEKV